MNTTDFTSPSELENVIDCRRLPKWQGSFARRTLAWQPGCPLNVIGLEHERSKHPEKKRKGQAHA